ncbi:MAG: c-type cytochrome [bacterium]|nr:c-type cytochrome [bacterium]
MRFRKVVPASKPSQDRTPSLIHSRGLLVLLAGILSFAAIACGPDVPQEPVPNKIAETQEQAAELSADLASGKSLYRANGCETCHGVQGEGDGPAGAGLNPPPRNLLETAGYKQGASEQAIVQTLATGVPGTIMQSYRHIKEADRRLIAQYILYLREQAGDRPES